MGCDSAVWLSRLSVMPGPPPWSASPKPQVPRRQNCSVHLTLPHQEGQEEKWVPGDGHGDLGPGAAAGLRAFPCRHQSLGEERHSGVRLLSSEDPFQLEPTCAIAGRGLYLPAPVWPPCREGELPHQ